MESEKSLGQLLKDIRKENKYTQEDVAKALFMSRRTLIRIENDETEPTIELLSQLSDLYRTNLLSLIYEKIKFKNASAMHIIQNLENICMNSNYDSIKSVLKDLYSICEKDPENKNLLQYYYTYCGFYYVNSSKMDLNLAIEFLNRALTIFNKNFIISEYKDFVYSDIELRALCALSLAYKKRDKTDEYEDILEYSFKTLKKISSTYFILGNQYASSLTFQSRIDESLSLVDKLIEKAKKYNHQVFLPLLFYLNFLNYNIVKDYEKSDQYLISAIALADVYSSYDLKNRIKAKSKIITQSRKTSK